MNSLSERLSLIMSFIPKGVSVCDVGCDHGYLSAALYLSGGFSHITATDIGESPLENARKNFEKLGVKGVELILSDGLQKVSREKAEYVVIAGMGGDVISGIIERCPYKNDVGFVLQPMTNSKALRIYLAQNGFKIQKEKAVKENGKIYSVMLCRFDGAPYDLTYAQKYIGILKPDNATNTLYIQKQYNICRKCASALKNIPEKETEYREYASAKEEIAKLLEE